MPKELEAKFLKIDPDQLRTKLQNSGFKQIDPLKTLRRYTYELAETGVGLGQKAFARVRDEGSRVAVAFKQVSDETLHGTEEVEFEVSSFEDAAKFMRCVGFEKCLYQENKRELWHNGVVEVALCRWPATSWFVEVEGESEGVIREASKALALPYESAIFGAVDIVYREELGVSLAQIRELSELSFDKESEIKQTFNAKNVA
jgi:adenylate cyclase class IV